jgi:F-type H+-transporting ATPase subunit gamma
LLPLKPGQTEDMVGGEAVEALDVPQPPAHNLEYIYEPSAGIILDLVLPRFLQLLIFQSVLDSQASEHAARMVAMRTASENAEDLAGQLQLTYNKARQLAITSEMLDIVGGAEALR